MEKVTKSIEVFIANDGKEFMNEKECKEYEALKSNIKYFKSFYSPDLTEGRGYSAEMYMAINPIASYIHSAYALKHMIGVCKGNVVEYVQGCEHAAMASFTVPEPITKEQYENERAGSIGDYRRRVTKVLLSDNPINGYPDNIKISQGRIV